MNKTRILGLTANVFFLGMVSLLNDMSSEMIFTLLPLFLSNVLGAAPTIIGFVEGVAESTASVMRVGSGWLSDRIGKRKILAVSGYTLSTIMKPLMYVASSWGLVLGVRFTDRLGKGIRSAPRDALVADSMTKEERGRGFGFHRAMDTAGAFLGIGAAAAVIYLLQQNNLDLALGTYQQLVLIGVVPAVIALFMFFFVKEEKKRVSPSLTSLPPEEGERREPPPGSSAGFARPQNGLRSGFGLPKRYWVFLGIVFLFTLGNSSDAFLVLRAQDLGNSTFHVMLMLLLFNGVYALISMPAGALSDRLGRKGLIIAGWAIFALARLGFSASAESWHIWALFAIWGVYYGLSEGVARAMVADLVPADRRGTAYGYYHGALGLGLLPASVLAGFLWQTVSPAAPFAFSAVTAVVAIIGLAVFVRK